MSNLIPNPEFGELGKFGLMRKRYLEEYNDSIHEGMLLAGELKAHLLMIQEQAEERLDLLMKQMEEREGDEVAKGTGSDDLGEGGGD